MAKETITVQCYPDDAIINKKIKEYEAFGWELIGNQHCQEYEGQTVDYGMDSTTTTRHYSSFNKLTFSREKSESWYREVSTLEGEYKKLMNKKPSEPYETKASKNYYAFIYLFAVFGIILIGFGGSVGITALLVIGILLIVASVVVIVLTVRKNKRYRSAYSYYYSALRDWEKTSQVEADKIRAKANRIVNS